MALPQQTPLIIINNDEDDDQRFTDQQLLRCTARYLSILEQRVEDQHRNINPHQIEVLSTRRQMLETLRTILNKSHQLVCSGSAQGFVFGLITENKIWAASSDNLRSWWKQDVNFERNGPRALLSLNVSETLPLESLKDLQDVTLSSITSALMRKCMPSQRSCPFHLGKPVVWWPTGTEEWWSQLNFPEDLGPPEYRKPHDLKKQWKVAVLVAVIKNLEPYFQKMRRLVCESQTVQNKMTHKENSIWLAVIRGEEMEVRHRLQLSDPESGLSNDDVRALGNSSSGSNIGGIVDKESEVCLVPSSLIKVESSKIADEETEALPSSLLRGERSEANKFKRIAIAEPEMIPIRSPTFSQGLILETSSTATSEGETSRRQKLKGIAIAEPGIWKLPNYQSSSCWGSSNFSQSSMSTNHQFPHQSQSNNMLHPSAMNYRLSNSSLHPSPTAFSMPCAEPGRFGVPTSLGSNNSQVNSSNFGGQVSKNNQVTSSNFGGQPSNNQMNSFKFSGQILSSNQVNSSNFGRHISNNNRVNFSDSDGLIPSINQVNFSNFGGQMSSNNQANSSNFGGQISNYMNSTTNAMNISRLNVASIPQSSNFVPPRNDQVIRAEGRNMPRTSAVDSMVQNLDLEGMDFEFTPFADSNLDFNFGLDSFTGGGDDARMMHQPNGKEHIFSVGVCWLELFGAAGSLSSSEEEEDGDKETIDPCPSIAVNMDSSPEACLAKVFLDDDAKEEDGSDHDLLRFQDNEEDDERDADEVYNDLIATGYEEAPTDHEKRNQLHQKWLKQQVAAGTDDILQRLKYGKKQIAPDCLHDGDEDEDEFAEESADEQSYDPPVANDARQNSKKAKQIIAQMFNDTVVAYVASDDEEAEQALLCRHILKRTDASSLISLVVDEQSREVFGSHKEG